MLLVAKHYVSEHAESMIVPLWRSGKNTNEIAVALGLPEHEIANRLPRLREARISEEQMSSGQKWTAEMDTELKEHYERGLSGSQIAVEMRRGLSRNAVIGRIHRTGINGNPPAREPTTREEREQKKRERAARKNERRNANRQRFRLDNPRPTLQEIQVRCVEIEPRNLSLVDLEPNDCRYVYGEGPYTFCAHPKFDGSSYCGPHHFLTIGAGTISERRAAPLQPRLLEAAE